MRTDFGGRPLVSARIDGRDEMLLVDTGAIYTMLTADAVDELKLSGRALGAHRFVFVTGASTRATAHARSFALGRLPLGGFTFLVTPATVRIPGAAGALGPDVMRGFDVEFDFAHARFNLFSQDHCDGGVVYWTQRPHAELDFTLDDSWHLTTSAMLDGHVVDIVIDTGTVSTAMTLEDAAREFGITPSSEGVTRVSAAGDPPTYVYAFPELNLQGITVAHPQILLRPDRTGISPSGLRPELVLGMNVLAQLHMYIAYRERKIYLTASEAQ